MAIRKINAVHGINRYIWNRIEQEGILSKSNYNNLVPIVPIEETPELIKIVEEQPGITSHPYIVYNWTKPNASQMWAVKEQQIVYLIRSADDMKTRLLTNLFDEEFEDWDEAAKRVNIYLSESNAPAQYLDFDYKEIHASSLGGAQPVGAEDDTNETAITLSITFTSPNKYWV